MPYILNKTNGVVLTVLEDASLDNSTNLTFVGKNYSGYGEVVNENFLKLLENFANTTQPSRPILGQLWFDSSPDVQSLKFCYNGKEFKRLAPLSVQNTTPTNSKVGDLWWNTDKDALYVYNGTKNVIINQDAGKSKWESKDETTLEGISYPVLEAIINDAPFITVARFADDLEKFIPTGDSLLYSEFINGVRKGITLPKCDANGSSKANGYYFWGTASESLRSEQSNYTSSITILNKTNSAKGYLTFVEDIVDGNKQVYSNGDLYYDFVNGVLSVTSISSRYADLAEKYEADDIYGIGTVLIIGGEKEVTATDARANTAVIGIVTKHPAYRMNAEAGPDKTHPYIALKGRVPCKVLGKVNRGDLLVTSTTPGFATRWEEGDSPNAVIGKALQDSVKEFDFIEVLVV